MKIPFDIKYRQEITNGEVKVVTRDDREVTVLRWDMKNNLDYPILYVAKDKDGTETANQCGLNGKQGDWDDDDDLFVVAPEPKFKVGDKITYRGENYEITGINYHKIDSLFNSSWMYEVKLIDKANDPEEVVTGIGRAAEDNMVPFEIPAMTAYEESVAGILFKNTKASSLSNLQCIYLAKDIVREIREEIKNDFRKNWNKYLTPQEVTDIFNEGIRKGQEELLEKLPRWKVADRDIISGCIEFVVVYRHDGGNHMVWDEVVPTNHITKGQKYFEIADLDELPSFKI